MEPHSSSLCKKTGEGCNHFHVTPVYAPQTGSFTAHTDRARKAPPYPSRVWGASVPCSVPSCDVWKLRAAVVSPRAVLTRYAWVAGRGAEPSREALPPLVPRRRGVPAHPSPDTAGDAVRRPRVSRPLGDHLWAVSAKSRPSEEVGEGVSGSSAEEPRDRKREKQLPQRPQVRGRVKHLSLTPKRDRDECRGGLHLGRVGAPEPGLRPCNLLKCSSREAVELSSAECSNRHRG